MITSGKSWSIAALLSVLMLCLIPGSAFAASPSTGTISEMVSTFHSKTSAWGTTLEQFAYSLFRWAIMLDIALFGIRMALQRSQVQDILAQFVMTLLFAGFIAAAISHYDTWSWNLIDGLASTAESLGASSSASDAPFLTGCAIVSGILEKLSITSPVDSLAYVVCALVTLVSFALMTARILCVKCEAMIAMNASVILLGLGGSSIFKEYAVNVMRYVLSVAFKLFVMQLLLGLGISFITDLELAEATMQDIFVVIGVSIVLLALVKTIPDACAGIINGSHVSGGHALTATAGAVLGAAVGGAAGAAAMSGGAAQGALNVRAASKLAGESGATGWGKLGHVAHNLFTAHRQARAESPRAPHGLRMGSRLQSRLQAMKMENALKNEDGDA